MRTVTDKQRRLKKTIRNTKRVSARAALRFVQLSNTNAVFRFRSGGEMREKRMRGKHVKIWQPYIS